MTQSASKVAAEVCENTQSSKNSTPEIPHIAHTRIDLNPERLRDVARALTIAADRIEAGDPWDIEGSVIVWPKAMNGFVVDACMVLNIKPTTRLCPECGSRDLVRLSSLQQKHCGDCGHRFDWDLADDQAPLVSNNRQKG